MPHCGRAVQVDSEPHCEPACECGHQFCFACCQAPHSPCSCDMCVLLLSAAISLDIQLHAVSHKVFLITLNTTLVAEHVCTTLYRLPAIASRCCDGVDRMSTCLTSGACRLQMAHVAGQDLGREREQDVDDGEHEAVPQVPVAGREELWLQPRHLPLRTGTQPVICFDLLHNLLQSICCTFMLGTAFS